MSEAVEYGVVKFYKDDKKFGFVTVLDADGNPTKTELFFHYNNGHFCGQADEPYFWFETGTSRKGKVYNIKAPEKGVKLVFTRGWSNKGERVAKWGFAESFDKIVAQLASRPTYRVIKHSDYYGKIGDNAVWEGKNVFELSASPEHYKEAKGGRGREFDMLDAGSADSGDMSWFYWFESLQDDGSWKECDDPRRFICCVPEHVYREHGPSKRQPLCYHGNR